jgi:thiol-disulfide isomerase/thioredoxin
MSQERRKKQQQRDQVHTNRIRKVASIGAVALLFLAVAGFALYKRDHRYDGFAKCLSDKKVVMYGAYWCPHCVEQKEKFAASFKFAPYVECGVPGNLRGEQQVCKDADIKHFPTWQFPPMGERVERVLSLEDLSDRTGCTLP